MHHLAVMTKSWKLIPKILSGEKTIESRWYQTKRAPWDRIRAGDIVFFKNSGEQVTARADVSEVMQFKLVSIAHVRRIIEQYGNEICLVNSDPETWGKKLAYCIVVRLEKPRAIEKPFLVNKKGFGSAVAWITVDDIKKLQYV